MYSELTLKCKALLQDRQEPMSELTLRSEMIDVAGEFVYLGGGVKVEISLHRLKASVAYANLVHLECRCDVNLVANVGSATHQ